MAKDSIDFGRFGSIDIEFTSKIENDNTIDYYDVDGNNVATLYEGDFGDSSLTVSEFTGDGSVMSVAEYELSPEIGFQTIETSYEKDSDGIIRQTEVSTMYDTDGKVSMQNDTEKFYIAEDGDVYELNADQLDNYLETGVLDGELVFDSELADRIIAISEDGSFPVEEVEKDTYTEVVEERMTDNSGVFEAELSYKTEDSPTSIGIEYADKNLDEDMKMCYYDDDGKLVAVVEYAEDGKGIGSVEIYGYDRDGQLAEKTVYEISDGKFENGTIDGTVERFLDNSYTREDGTVSETFTEIVYADGETIEVETEYEYTYDAESGNILVDASADGMTDSFVITPDDDRYEHLCEIIGIESDPDEVDPPDMGEVPEDAEPIGEDDLNDTEYNPVDIDE